MVPSYLVEAFVPRLRGSEVRKAARRARAAAEELAGEGTPIRYVRTTFLPDDETCFYVFVAPSAAVVEELGRRASLAGIRIVKVVE